MLNLLPLLYLTIFGVKVDLCVESMFMSLLCQAELNKSKNSVYEYNTVTYIMPSFPFYLTVHFILILSTYVAIMMENCNEVEEQVWQYGSPVISLDYRDRIYAYQKLLPSTISLKWVAKLP